MIRAISDLLCCNDDDDDGEENNNVTHRGGGGNASTTLHSQMFLRHSIAVQQAGNYSQRIAGLSRLNRSGVLQHGNESRLGPHNASSTRASRFTRHPWLQYYSDKVVEREFAVYVYRPHRNVPTGYCVLACLISAVGAASWIGVISSTFILLIYSADALWIITAVVVQVVKGQLQSIAENRDKNTDGGNDSNEHQQRGAAYEERLEPLFVQDLVEAEAVYRFEELNASRSRPQNRNSDADADSPERRLEMAQYRHSLRSNAATHEFLIVLVMIANIVMSIGVNGGQGGCTYVPIERRVLDCLEAINTEGGYFVMLGASVFLTPTRITRHFLLYLVWATSYMLVLFVAVGDLLVMRYFYSLLSIVVSETTAAMISLYLREKKARDNFEVYCDRHHRAIEVAHVRRQTEKMVAAQIPVQAILGTQVHQSETGSLLGWNGNTVVCVFAVDGFVSWSSKRGPIDAVSLIKRVTDTFDAQRRLCQRPPAKYHSHGDLYFVIDDDDRNRLNHRHTTKLRTAGSAASHGVSQSDRVQQMFLFALRCVIEAQSCVTWHSSALSSNGHWDSYNGFETPDENVERNKKALASQLQVKAALEVGQAGGLMLRASKNICAVGPAVSSALGTLHRSLRSFRECTATQGRRRPPVVFVSGRCVPLLPHSIASYLRIGSQWADKDAHPLKASDCIDQAALVCCADKPRTASQPPPESESHASRGWLENSSHPTAEGESSPAVAKGSGGLRDFDHADDSISTPAINDTTIVRQFYIFLRFAGDEVENQYLQTLDDYSDVDALWCGLSALFSFSGILGICFVYSMWSVADAMQPLVWILVGCSLGLVVVFVVLLVKPKSWRITLPDGFLFDWRTQVLSALSLGIAMCFAAAVFVAPEGNVLGDSHIVWLFILLNGSLLRPTWERPGVMWIRDFVTCIAFFLRTYSRFRMSSTRTTALYTESLIIVYSWFIRVLLDESRREAFATELQAKRLKNLLHSENKKFNDALREVAPEGVAAQLIGQVRQSRFANAVGPAVSLRTPTHSHQAKLRLNPITSTNISTQIHEVPFLVVSLRPPLVAAASSIGAHGPIQYNGESDYWFLNIQPLMRLHAIVSVAVREVNLHSNSDARSKLQIVKATEDVVLIACYPTQRKESSEKRKTSEEERCHVVYQVCEHLWRVVRATEMSRSIRTTLLVAPAMGAVLGTESVCFEYFTGQLGCALAYLRRSDWGSATATPRFIERFVASLCIGLPLSSLTNEQLFTEPAERVMQRLAVGSSVRVWPCATLVGEGLPSFRLHAISFSKGQL